MWMYDFTCERLINLNFVSEIEVHEALDWEKSEYNFLVRAFLPDTEERVVLDTAGNYGEAKSCLDKIFDEMIRA